METPYFKKPYVNRYWFAVLHENIRWNLLVVYFFYQEARLTSNSMHKHQNERHCHKISNILLDYKAEQEFAAFLLGMALVQLPQLKGRCPIVEYCTIRETNIYFISFDMKLVDNNEVSKEKNLNKLESHAKFHFHQRLLEPFMTISFYKYIFVNQRQYLNISLGKTQYFWCKFVSVSTVHKTGSLTHSGLVTQYDLGQLWLR